MALGDHEHLGEVTQKANGIHEPSPRSLETFGPWWVGRLRRDAWGAGAIADDEVGPQIRVWVRIGRKFGNSNEDEMEDEQQLKMMEKSCCVQFQMKSNRSLWND